MIENFTPEYIEPLLAVDFSDILAKDEESEKADHTEDELDDIDALLAEVESKKQDEIDDELDIDALINEHSETVDSDDSAEKDDIGDDLISQPDNLNDLGLADEEVIASLDDDFDEEALAKLLSDEDDESLAAENEENLPDYNDSNVLADLLNDVESGEEAKKPVEINDIEQLDSVEFDELLADIAEETADLDLNEPNELIDDLDIGDDLLASTDEKASPEDFVDVDNLIAEGMDSALEEEPYNKQQIDVGLDEYPEFTENVNPIDVDEENLTGMAQKLDLAKVYIDMEDYENAEVLLKEVMAKGDDKQGSEAQKLLNSFK